MPRCPRILLLALLLIAPASASRADVCTTDAVPAATLLVPYFEVDVLDQDCITTLFSINNASETPTLAHVTFWTDWSIPTVDFDVFLTGYDVYTINLQDIFRGIIQITADEQSDPDDTISPHGGLYSNHPEWDGSFTTAPNCANFFPFFENPMIQGFRLDLLRNGHRGLPVQFGDGLCIGAVPTHKPNHARGYITIDNAVRCGLEDPTSPDYFGGANPVASNVNQLWGDFFLVDPPNNYAIGEPMVHIEAGEDIASQTGYTFYGRYNAGTGIDQREPLSTIWALRYLNGGNFDGGTDLLVWRDSTAFNTGFFTCGVGPNWHPLNETQVVAFNESEDAVELCFDPGGGVISPPDPSVDPACFPLETQRTLVGEGDLDPPYTSGWMYLNLNVDDVGVTGDVDFGANGDIAQSYVIAQSSASGRYSIGLEAVELANACDDINLLLPAPALEP